MSAELIQHPSAPVQFDPPPVDPREQPVAVPVGYVAPLWDDDWDRLDGILGLSNLMEKFGSRRVLSWVRNLAAINGEDIDN